MKNENTRWSRQRKARRLARITALCRRLVVLNEVSDLDEKEAELGNAIGALLTAELKRLGREEFDRWVRESLPVSVPVEDKYIAASDAPHPFHRGRYRLVGNDGLEPTDVPPEQESTGPITVGDTLIHGADLGADIDGIYLGWTRFSCCRWQASRFKPPTGTGATGGLPPQRFRWATSTFRAFGISGVFVMKEPKKLVVAEAEPQTLVKRSLQCPRSD